MSYKAEFFDKLLENIRQLEGKLTADKENHLTRSIENTCYFAQALHDTFKDVGDVGMLLAMRASCDYSPINKK
ncbi:hypothetical protein LCGC14_0572100 [marine sediment metagenome]|uniref:Uncharacterized protein n=1 Tax=marine sediment metagenome TaxID=412755 RepID=A0A0F9S2I3_9ZZZZ